MCCVFTILLFSGPRAGILIWYLINPTRWNLAFDNWFMPLLGSIFLPWTTLMYMIVFPSGVNGLEWLWMGLGLLADIGMYFGGGAGNRSRFGG